MGEPATHRPDVKYGAEDIARILGLAHPPTPEQAAVVEAPLRPVLVVAGAGSGKTETMAARVVWLVANGLAHPEEVLGLTFTRKAAGELAERIGVRLDSLRAAGLWVPRSDADAGPLGGVPTVSTYHAYAGQLVRDHGLLLGREPDARLLGEAAAWQLAHEAVLGWDGDMRAVGNTETTVTAAVVDLAAELAEHLRTPSEVAATLVETIATLETVPRGASRKRAHPLQGVIDGLRARLAIAPIVERFDALKTVREVLDFSDQTGLAARLARAYPQVGAGERQRFKVVLLDEFQDTSHAQLALLMSLFVAPGEPVPVTAVGDPNQSIYGWRGASATTLESFVAAFADPRPADQLTLSTSWRNDSGILAVANRVAAPLRRRSTGVRVPELVPRPGAGMGTVRLGRYETHEDEAAAVAQWLAEQRADNPSVTAAVLCRKRSQFLPIVRALDDAGLPHEVVGLGGLLLTPEVGDILALLNVVHDPSRGDELMRLLTGPRVRLGAADLDGLAAWARALAEAGRGAGHAAGGPAEIGPDAANLPSIVDALDDLPEPDWLGPRGERIGDVGLDRLHGLARIVHRLRELTGAPLADLVGEAERSLGLDIEVLSRPEYTPSAARAHLDALADVAAQYTSTADRPTLGGFLAWAHAAVEEERGLERRFVESNPDAIQVMTIHAAKGLEWDVVAVPGLTEGTFPDHCALASPREGEWRVGEPKGSAWLGGLTSRGLPFPLRGDAEGLPAFRLDAVSDWDSLAVEWERFRSAVGRHELTEERRLAYVALTRARRSVLLTASVWFTGHRPRVTSRFLTELREALDSGSLGTAGSLGEWCEMPRTDPPPLRPVNRAEDGVTWPVDLLAGRRRSAADAARAVCAAREAAADQDRCDPDEREVTIRLLLAEREQRRRGRDPVAILPEHLSASQLVALTADRERFALDIRRPVPVMPDPAARQGTRFHAWVERYYAQAAMLDPEELPGSGDEETAGGAAFSHLLERFRATVWADRVPAELETAVETVLDGVAVRGRIDAVFRDGKDWIIVDWKTGAAPNGPLSEARTVQLAAYRIAWARLRSVPVDRVRAAFCFVATGETLWPELPDEARLVEILQGRIAPR